MNKKQKIKQQSNSNNFNQNLDIIFYDDNYLKFNHGYDDLEHEYEIHNEYFTVSIDVNKLFKIASTATRKFIPIHLLKEEIYENIWDVKLRCSNNKNKKIRKSISIDDVLKNQNNPEYKEKIQKINSTKSETYPIMIIDINDKPVDFRDIIEQDYEDTESESDSESENDQPEDLHLVSNSLKLSSLDDKSVKEEELNKEDYKISLNEKQQDNCESVSVVSHTTQEEIGYLNIVDGFHRFAKQWMMKRKFIEVSHLCYDHLVRALHKITIKNCNKVFGKPLHQVFLGKKGKKKKFMKDEQLNKIQKSIGINAHNLRQLFVQILEDEEYDAKIIKRKPTLDNDKPYMLCLTPPKN
mgnify:CR=1 FL=1